MARVLIIDDSAFMRIAIKNILEMNGFEIVGEAENGFKGLIKYKQCKPDLVTLDITMPEMNGIEALKAILAYDPKAKVVMVSAMGQEAIVKEAMLFGAKSFILKPFKEDHVVRTLKRVFP
ncbi:MAG: response regulator [Peptococcaceae bacterium]|nr:response regulator [Peptococcaceae bacterium]